MRRSIRRAPKQHSLSPTTPSAIRIDAMRHPFTRLKTPLLALLLSASTLLCARTTHAYEPMKTAFMLDFASGVAIPIADDNYTKLADPSFKLSLRAGVVFYVSRYFG